MRKLVSPLILFWRKYRTKSKRQNISINWNPDIAEELVRYAVLAYEDKETVEKALPNRNFHWFEARGGLALDTQAFACDMDNGDLAISFRGTKEWRDWITDLKFKKKKLMSFSGNECIRVENFDTEVHGGFSDALDAIWSDKTYEYDNSRKHSGTTLTEFLADKFDPEEPDKRQVWLTGHSLGGALATIAAARIQLSTSGMVPFRDQIGGLITIGSPRVLGPYASYELEEQLTDDKIFRIYRTFDPVPAFPRIRYKHVSGERCVIGNGGELVLGARKSRWLMSLVAQGLRVLEDIAGAAIPGQHRLNGLIADHDKQAYYESVRGFVPGTTMHAIPLFKSIASSSVKLLLVAGGVVGGLTLFGADDFDIARIENELSTNLYEVRAQMIATGDCKEAEIVYIGTSTTLNFNPAQDAVEFKISKDLSDPSINHLSFEIANTEKNIQLGGVTGMFDAATPNRINTALNKYRQICNSYVVFQN